MSRPFPKDNSFLQGNFAPWPMEGKIHDLVVEGELPRELAGTLYRNGPNPQYAPRGRYHWFDGDGMIHALRFEDGRAHYRNRWVRTERFQREREAGRALFGGLADMAASDPEAAGTSPNAANTNIVWHAGRLLALWEAGPPHELDPDTLETRGTWDFAGELTRPLDPEQAQAMGLEPGAHLPGIMTAHPKLDPATGEMHFFGYSALPPYLIYYVADERGRIVRSEQIDVPFASMMHDFVVTEEHVIFPVFPAVFDLSLLESGGTPLAWQPERGTHIGIMPRDGGNSDVTWVRSDPCYVFHPMNAHSENGRVIAEVVRHPVLPLFGVEGGGASQLYRWTIDLAGGAVKEEPLDDVTMEFPRLDERYAGQAYRYGYGAGRLDREDFSKEQRVDTLLVYDLATGRRRGHTFRAGSSTSEPVFVPRRADSAEGEGFLLAVVYREDERRSDVVVLDAENAESEPLAVVQLPHRVPFGFHGNWRPA
jgi:carotenoid cleavage dioxygenase-like enzyme